MKTTGKHLKYFKTRVNYWLKKLNLQNYNITVCHDYISIDGCPCRGACDRDKGARHGIIFLGKDWGDPKLNPINNKELNEVALHEVLELLLFDIVRMISCRFMDSANIEPEKHNIIQTLVKALLK